MTQIELIDRLCAVNTLLTDIVREQAERKRKRAEDENDAIEAALRNYI